MAHRETLGPIHAETLRLVRSRNLPPHAVSRVTGGGRQQLEWIQGVKLSTRPDGTAVVAVRGRGIVGVYDSVAQSLDCLGEALGPALPK